MDKTILANYILDCLKNLGDLSEISDESVLQAKTICDSVNPVTEDDILLILCSLNLLNAAIKKAEFKPTLSYGFIKKRAAKLVADIDRIASKQILYFYNKTERCLYFKSGEIIFSFHEVPLTSFILKAAYSTPIVWGGIRLQKIAQSLFNYVLQGR